MYVRWIYAYNSFIFLIISSLVIIKYPSLPNNFLLNLLFDVSIATLDLFCVLFKWHVFHYPYAYSALAFICCFHRNWKLEFRDFSFLSWAHAHSCVSLLPSRFLAIRQICLSFLCTFNSPIIYICVCGCVYVYSYVYIIFLSASCQPLLTMAIKALTLLNSAAYYLWWMLWE